MNKQDFLAGWGSDYKHWITSQYFRKDTISTAVELHLSVLIRRANHPDMQKIRIKGYFFENRLLWQFEVQVLLFIVYACV